VFWSSVIFILLKCTCGVAYKEKKIVTSPDTVKVGENIISADYFKGKADVGFGSHPVRPTHRKPLEQQFWRVTTPKQDLPITNTTSTETANGDGTKKSKWKSVLNYIRKDRKQTKAKDNVDPAPIEVKSTDTTFSIAMLDIGEESKDGTNGRKTKSYESDD